MNGDDSNTWCGGDLEQEANTTVVRETREFSGVCASPSRAAPSAESGTIAAIARAGANTLSGASIYEWESWLDNIPESQGRNHISEVC